MIQVGMCSVSQISQLLLYILSRHSIFTDLIKSCIMKQFMFYIFTGGEGFQLGNVFELVHIIIEVFFCFPLPTMKSDSEINQIYGICYQT